MVEHIETSAKPWTVSSTDLKDIVSSGLRMVEHIETSAKPWTVSSLVGVLDLAVFFDSSLKSLKGSMWPAETLSKTLLLVMMGMFHLLAAAYLSPEGEGVMRAVVWSFSRLGLYVPPCSSTDLL